MYICKRTILVFASSNISSEESGKCFFPLCGIVVFLLLDVSTFPYASQLLLKASFLWNIISLMVLLSDVCIFRFSTTSSTLSTAVSVVLISSVLLAILTVSVVLIISL